jgi:hypothetical protein
MSTQKKSSLKKQNRVLILECEQRTSNTPILPCSFAVWGQSLPRDGQFRYEFGEQRIGQPAGRVVGQPFLPLQQPEKGTARLESVGDRFSVFCSGLRSAAPSFGRRHGVLCVDARRDEDAQGTFAVPAGWQ